MTFPHRGFLLTIICLTLLHSCQPQPTKTGCGYDSCDLGKPGYINVHLVAHTHDDVGWLKTVDQYYYGSLNTIQRAGVQYILDTVVQALDANPERKFTYVEMAFFHRWWTNQSERIRALVKKLVRRGQLQFALGAWCMADEATVHYSDAIDQMTLGHALLKDLFGEKCGLVTDGWQIDPFGHSRDHSDLFTESGFNSVYFQRFDYREKDERRREKKLQMIWDTGVEFKQNGQGLFTSSFFDSYCYPASFCFDDKCSDEPIQDDPRLEDYNVDRRVDRFIDYIENVRKAYATDHILIPMGCDFTYENANVNFKNTDKLIHHTNKLQRNGSKVNLIYSTPKCYTKAVNQAFNRDVKTTTIPRRGGDFFPYASSPQSYWTGFFTSRPALKEMVRKASTLLTATEHHFLFANQTHTRNAVTTNEARIDSLRQSMGVLQHHDAVTGTEKQHVANDYAKRLHRAMVNGQRLISSVAMQTGGLLEPLTSLIDNRSLTFCNLVNISQCEATYGRKAYFSYADGTGGVYITYYNPLGWSMDSLWARVPIELPENASQDYSVSVLIWQQRRLEELPVQLIPVSRRTQRIPGRRSSANFDVVFQAASSEHPLPPTGYAIFFMTIHEKRKMPKLDRPKAPELTRSRLATDFKPHIERIGSGVNVVFTQRGSGRQQSVMIQPMFYIGQAYGYQSSGAYIFLPMFDSEAIAVPGPAEYEHHAGQLVDEVWVTYPTLRWISFVVRNYKISGEVEVEWTVGPIPDGALKDGHEVIMRYTVTEPGFGSKVSGEFFTDSAGRRMIRRLRNDRVDWNLSGGRFNETERVAGNYYPVLNRIRIDGRDGNSFAVYTDRAQGGSSLADGQIELMVHRRCVRDDGFGVGEALLENGPDKLGLIVRGKHLLVFDESTHLERTDFQRAHEISRPPIAMYGSSVKPPSASLKQPKWQAVTTSLPSSLHLLSLGSWPFKEEDNVENKLLLRLESDANAEPSDISVEYLDVTNWLNGLEVFDAVEMSLTGSQERAKMLQDRLHWPTEAMNRTRVDRYLSTAGRQTTRRNGRVVVAVPKGKIATYLLSYRKV